jgi:hypothetical protein
MFFFIYITLPVYFNSVLCTFSIIFYIKEGYEKKDAHVFQRQIHCDIFSSKSLQFKCPVLDFTQTSDKYIHGISCFMSLFSGETEKML